MARGHPSHRLVVLDAASGGAIAICKACGKVSEGTVRYLASPCVGLPGLSTWGRTALKRVARAQHPVRPSERLVGVRAMSLSLRAAGFGVRAARQAAAPAAPGSAAVSGAAAARTSAPERIAALHARIRAKAEQEQ